MDLADTARKGRQGSVPRRVTRASSACLAVADTPHMGRRGVLGRIARAVNRAASATPRAPQTLTTHRQRHARTREVRAVRRDFVSIHYVASAGPFGWNAATLQAYPGRVRVRRSREGREKADVCVLGYNINVH